MQSASNGNGNLLNKFKSLSIKDGKKMIVEESKEDAKPVKKMGVINPKSDKKKDYFHNLTLSIKGANLVTFLESKSNGEELVAEYFIDLCKEEIKSGKEDFDMAALNDSFHNSNHNIFCNLAALTLKQNLIYAALDKQKEIVDVNENKKWSIHIDKLAFLLENYISITDILSLDSSLKLNYYNPKNPWEYEMNLIGRAMVYAKERASMKYPKDNREHLLEDNLTPDKVHRILKDFSYTPQEFAYFLAMVGGENILSNQKCCYWLYMQRRYLIIYLISLVANYMTRTNILPEQILKYTRYVIEEWITLFIQKTRCEREYATSIANLFLDVVKHYLYPKKELSKLFDEKKK